MSQLTTNSAVHACAMAGAGNRAPPLPVVCVAASVAFHALVFLSLPGMRRETTIPPAPVLDVRMVSRAAEAPAVPPYRTPSQSPARAMFRPAVREPAPTPASAAVVPTVAVAAGFAAPVAPSRATAEAIPAPRVDPVTAPAFSAAYLRNPPPRYPPAARRNGDEGTVLLKVLVSTEGMPARVELEQSSGSSPLDGAALDAVRSWRFVPARRGGQPMEDWVRVPVVFRLES